MEEAIEKIYKCSEELSIPPKAAAKTKAADDSFELAKQKALADQYKNKVKNKDSRLAGKQISYCSERPSQDADADHQGQGRLHQVLDCKLQQLLNLVVYFGMRRYR